MTEPCPVREIINDSQFEVDMRNVYTWALGIHEITGDAGPTDEERGQLADLMACELMRIGQRLDEAFDKLHAAAVKGGAE